MGLSRHPFSDMPPAWARVPVDKGTSVRLRLSFGLLSKKVPSLAHVFWRMLFAQYPYVRNVLAIDLPEQERQLMELLKLVVDHMDKPEVVRPRLRELGVSNAERGMQPEHYPIVADLVVAAMGEVGREFWTKQLASDWRQVLDITCAAMLEGVVRPQKESGTTLTRS